MSGLAVDRAKDRDLKTRRVVSTVRVTRRRVEVAPQLIVRSVNVFE